jgi:hypothetical protein
LCDAGIRVGESLRDGLTAVRIMPRLRFAVVGLPAYFGRRPAPRTPADLKGHVCIQNLYPTGVRYAWEFKKDYYATRKYISAGLRAVIEAMRA